MPFPALKTDTQGLTPPAILCAPISHPLPVSVRVAGMLRACAEAKNGCDPVGHRNPSPGARGSGGGGGACRGGPYLLPRRYNNRSRAATHPDGTPVLVSRFALLSRQDELHHPLLHLLHQLPVPGLCADSQPAGPTCQQRSQRLCRCWGLRVPDIRVPFCLGWLCGVRRPVGNGWNPDRERDHARPQRPPGQLPRQGEEPGD